MNLRIVTLFSLLITCSCFAQAQNAVGIGTANPNKNAVLHLVSPENNQGFLLPRLSTAQRTANAFVSSLSSDDNGLLVFDQDEQIFYFWNTNQWQPVGTSVQLTAGNGIILSENTIEAIPQDLQLSGNTLTITNNPSATSIDLSAFSGNNTDDQTLSYTATSGELTITRMNDGDQSVTITPAGLAGGDLSGNYPNPGIANNAVNSAKISDGTILGQDISDGTIATADIADLAIVDSKVAPGLDVSKLSSGNNGEVLTVGGGVVQWANAGTSTLINDIGTRNLNAGNSSSTNGTDNAVFGESTGTNNSGNYNVFVGTQAAQNKTTGDLNTIIGWFAGRESTHHQGNTFVGAQAGEFAGTSTNISTFIGEKAGWNVTSATGNVMVGQRAGENTTTGFFNVIVGTTAAATNVTGTRLTLIGRNADVSASNLNNATAIGENAIVNASNKVRIGNADVTVIEGQVTFTSASDRRLKTDIHDIDSGLELIKKMRPVAYRMKNSSDKRINWGFIAQDIESIVGNENAIVTVSGDKQHTLGLRYTDLIAPLVKAVQEQQDEIEALKSQVKMLTGKLDEREAQSNELTAMKEQLQDIRHALGLEAGITIKK